MEQQQNQPALETTALLTTTLTTANSSAKSETEKPLSTIDVLEGFQAIGCSIGSTLQALVERMTPERRAEVLNQVREDKLKREKLLAELRKEIGDWLTLADAKQIQAAREDAEYCAKCQGLPCTKNKSPRWKSKLTVDVESQRVEVRSAVCEFEKARRKKAELQRRFKRCGIPAKYVGKTFEDYQVTPQNTRAVKAAKWATKNPDKGIYFHGMTGCGKTFLAAIIAQELLKAGKTVIFGDVPTLLDTLKGTFAKDSDTTIEELMDELQNADVLVLDDIGTEYPTDWAAERLYMVVNNRYNAGKPIIVTSNYAPKKLLERFKGNVTGARIVSRLCQMCEVVENRELDFRMRD